MSFKGKNSCRRTPYNFPTTTGAFQTSFGGGNCDAFVTKLNATGTAMLYSTYLGGNSFDDGEGVDSGSGVAVDASGNAYVTGYTISNNFPTTPGTSRPVAVMGVVPTLL